MTHDHSVLIVEDNADDVLFIRRALRKSGIDVPVDVVGDGDAALEYLLGRGEHADRVGQPVPTLVLLDLKLPRRSGIEVLEALRTEPVRSQMVIVVLSGSSDSSDIQRAYAAGANSYLVKPILPASMNELVERLSLYWLVSNEPSPRPRIAD